MQVRLGDRKQFQRSGHREVPTDFPSVIASKTDTEAATFTTTKKAQRQEYRRELGEEFVSGDVYVGIK